MKRTVVFCSFLMVAALGAGGSARAGDSGPPDLTGYWRLNPQHSDAGRRPGGGFGGGGGGAGRMGRHGGGGGGWGGGGGGGWGGGGGGWGGRGGGRRGGGGGDEGGAGAGESDQASMRPARLPDYIHITQTAALVSFADSTGTVLRDVAEGGAPPDSTPNVEHLSGQWKGKKLVIERSGPRDSKITETISIENKGNSLQIDTKIEGGDRSREFKRVYDRVIQG